MKRLSLLPLLLIATACNESARKASGPIVRDSANIQIVESAAPGWDTNQGWTLSPNPILSIGQQEGDEKYLFARVGQVRRLSDGRIIVADGASSQIRFYDSAGTYLNAVGRAGAGPGEFQFLSSVDVVAGDTLLVRDLNGLTVLSSNGAYVRQLRLTPVEDRYRATVAGALRSGGLLAVSGSRGFSPADAGQVIRDSLRFYSFQADGRLSGNLAILPSAERWGFHNAGMYTFPYLPFATNPVYAAGTDRFYIGSGRDAEVRVYRDDASLERILRWQAARRAVVEQDKSDLRTQLLNSARDDNERRRQEVFLAEVPMATHMPAYTSALVDSDDNLWLQIYRPPWETQPRWHVLSKEGGWLGTVDTPPQYDVHQIGSGFVLGIWRDDSDVQYVRMYELIKPQ